MRVHSVVPVWLLVSSYARYVLSSYVTTTEPVDQQLETLGLNDGGGMIEGDMVFTGGRKLQSRQKRQVLKSVQRWNVNYPISYSFSEQFHASERRLVEQALSLYSKQTCLRFTENGRLTPVVTFVKRTGCYSQIGMAQRAKTQIVSLPDYCLASFTTILHEIAHTLGLLHEHSRLDRDMFVKVHPQNVVKHEQHNLGIVTNSKIMSAYDYSSFMHYGNRAFSKNNQPTISAVDSKFERTMGNNVYPSASVFKVVNDFYNCSINCKNTIPECLHGGYPNPNLCTNCNCPEGFGGDLCDQRAHLTGTTCGEDLNATDDWQTTNATLLRNMGPSPVSFYCYYYIRAPPGKKISIRIKSLRMLCTTMCSWNNLVMNLGFDWFAQSFRFCCPRDINSTQLFVSKDHEAIIGLYTRRHTANVVFDYKAEAEAAL